MKKETVKKVVDMIVSQMEFLKKHRNSIKNKQKINAENMGFLKKREKAAHHFLSKIQGADGLSLASSQI